MNIKKSKIALALGGLLFLSVPLSSAFADENHCEMSSTMKSMKSELHGYVKGIKGDDADKMEQHLNQLLQLSDTAIKDMPEMDHSKMDMNDMTEMDHSKMDMKDMPEMDHSKMSMEGMSDEHHQQMMYMEGMTELNEQFMQLANTQDKDEIKVIMGHIKENSKKNQLFRKNCN